MRACVRACVHAYVCVCLRERERERELEALSFAFMMLIFTMFSVVSYFELFAKRGGSTAVGTMKLAKHKLTDLAKQIYLLTVSIIII